MKNYKNIDGFKVAFREQSADEKVIDQSFQNDLFFRYASELKLAKDGIIIDIGAHIGTFALKASRKVSNGYVYAIEAEKENYKLLSENIEINKLKNIVPINIAISGKSGKVNLYLSDESWSHNMFYDSSGRIETVESKKLSEFLDNHNIKSCDLLKFNCEGAEFEIVMQTDIAHLVKIKFIIILYHLDLTSKNYSLDDLKSKLNSSGFYFREIKTGRDRGWIIAKNKKYYNKLSDFLRRASIKIKSFI